MDGEHLPEMPVVVQGVATGHPLALPACVTDLPEMPVVVQGVATGHPLALPACDLPQQSSLLYTITIILILSILGNFIEDKASRD